MLILGINAYHGDSSACLVRDGNLIAAAEEERFRRIKHWAGLPTEAIAYCLGEAGIQLGDTDHIAINRQPKANLWRRCAFLAAHRPDLGLVLNRLKNIRKAATIEDALVHAFPGQRIIAGVHHIEHHLAHLASAFFVSDFREAVCVSIDGFGDFASLAWGFGRGHEITVDGRVYFPHSLGIFYSAITQLLGFPHYGDEFKVMGLAPYGEPKCVDAMRRIVFVRPDGTYRLNLRYFRHHRENVSYAWDQGAPEFGPLYSPELEVLLGPARKGGEPLEQRHRDIARSAQAVYEEAFFTLLNVLHQKYQCPNLALSGGCAMNSVANGKIYLRSPFRKLYLPPAAGDAGGAIGAAFAVWNLVGQPGRNGRAVKAAAHGPSRSASPGCGSSANSNGRFVMRNAYVGPCFDDVAIESLLKARGLLNPRPSAVRLSVDRAANEEALCRRTAQAISEGKVVGWFQGRMEWGPRALGNRSILCDPRRADMKDILNAKIKRRESFRPFAPSILREHVTDWFEQDDDVPFMMQVFQVRSEKRALVPATTHVDGSGRLQTVHRDTNPLYWQLITNFHSLTSVPMVLNTSFNENEPVVCRPEEALDCFLRTDMDVLVLGSYCIKRERA